MRAPRQRDLLGRRWYSLWWAERHAANLEPCAARMGVFFRSSLRRGAHASKCFISPRQTIGLRHGELAQNNSIEGSYLVAQRSMPITSGKVCGAVFFPVSSCLNVEYSVIEALGPGSFFGC